MDFHAKHPADLVDFARSAKSGGAHGVTFISQKETVMYFGAVRGASNGPAAIQYDICICTSIGSIHWSKKVRKDSDENMNVEVLLPLIEEKFPFSSMSKLSYNDDKQRWTIEFGE